MNILCIGGGPAGLYFGLLMKLQDLAHRVVVVERNKPFDTFGWGVVLSDQTLDNLRAADPVTGKLASAASPQQTARDWKTELELRERHRDARMID